MPSAFSKQLPSHSTPAGVEWSPKYPEFAHPGDRQLMQDVNHDDDALHARDGSTPWHTAPATSCLDKFRFVNKKKAIGRSVISNQSVIMTVYKPKGGKPAYSYIYLFPKAQWDLAEQIWEVMINAVHPNKEAVHEMLIPLKIEYKRISGHAG